MNNAYVTTLCHGDAYLPGVEVLGKSLDINGTSVPKIVLATADVPAETRARLSAQGWQVRDIEPIANPAQGKLLFPRFESVFCKLRVWELTDLDRAVFLDADTLLLQNVDELFDRPGFAAAPDFFLPDHFNSGVMVVQPSAQTFAKMMEALAAAGSYDGGDQGFLNTFFADWYAMPVEHRLPAGYNMAHFIYQFLRGHPTLKDALERDAKIVHYMVQKPWQASAVLTGGSAVWWQRYFEVHPELRHEWRNRVHILQDWTFDHLAALVVN